MFNFITFFLLNPILWLGILMTFLIGHHRIKSERKQFSIAINSHYSEMIIFLKNGLFVSLIGSITTLVFGVTINVTWLSWYLLLMLLSLLLCFLFWDSGILLAMVSLFTIFWPKFKFIPVPFQDFSSVTGVHNLASGLIVLGMSLLGLGMILSKPPDILVSPEVRVSKRGIREASYRVRRLYLVPLFLLIPGDGLIQFIHFWPFFNIGQHQFTILVLPLILGLNFHLKKRLPFELTQLSRSYFIAGSTMLICAIFSRIFKMNLFFGVLSIVGMVGLRMYSMYFLSKGQDYLVEPTKGIQVLAVQTDTPAQKAGLEPGDIVLSVNDQPISSQTQFYEMTQTNATFVKLRVQTLHGEIKLAETAIYKDSPHELGLVTFPDQTNQENRRRS